MKINYSEIITKANARKDALEEAVFYVERFDDEVEVLQASLRFIKDFAAVLERLDGEGRVILGIDLYQKAQLLAARTQDYRGIADKYIAEISGLMEE